MKRRSSSLFLPVIVCFGLLVPLMEGLAAASDSGVVIKKLCLSRRQNTGNEVVNLVGTVDQGFEKGPDGNPALLSGSLSLRYGNGTATGLIGMPAPWDVNDSGIARYRKLMGSTTTALIRAKPAKRLTVRTSHPGGLGGLDISQPPGPDGIIVELTLNNGNDGSVHRMCARFAAATGSTIGHRTNSRNTNMCAFRGVGIDCSDACADNFQNATETDVDCGGNCPDCQVGEHCKQGSDCTEGVCVAGVCAAPTCIDTVSNGDETGIDCGNSCPACPDVVACDDTNFPPTADPDCVSGVCVGNMCQVPTCIDGVLNGVESDLDCGGNCSGCADGNACDIGGDCSSGVCIGNICQAPTCIDAVRNDLETDVDCGGGGCPTCANGSDCSTDTDCTNLVCNAGICLPPVCGDAVKNGQETDVDCGGRDCLDCLPTKTCHGAGDCNTGVCTAGTCQPARCSPADGVSNGLETGIDCGGTTACPDCADSQACTIGSDCINLACTAGLCTAPNCIDRVKNGSESGTDCGGGGCPTCQNGETCTTASNCASAYCAIAMGNSSGICQNPVCGDGVKNGSETAVDCGGAVCPTCSVGRSCSIPGDCSSSVCSSGSCAAPVCSDSVKNGLESGVDCGGPICADCGVGGGCNLGSDCTTGSCVGAICQAPSCIDGVRNGSETGVDCGASCPDCSNGQGCSSASDCVSGYCDGICLPPSCGDTVKNGTETDVDCGGLCNGCAPSERCSSAGDCASDVCTSTFCQAPTCVDFVKNGTETDTDCGGASCARCGTGNSCLASADCDSRVCTGSSCAAPSCSDGVLNGTESDVDCGGSCSACNVGEDCNLDGDCSSGLTCLGVCQAAAGPTPTPGPVCTNQTFQFFATANNDVIFSGDGDLSDEWPGFLVTAEEPGNPGCKVDVRTPSGNIDLVCGLNDSWSIVSITGFSNCTASACEIPTCDAPAAFGSCCPGTGRPSCSSGLGEGNSRTTFTVNCVP